MRAWILLLVALAGACANDDFSVNADSGSSTDSVAADSVFNHDLPPLPDGYNPYTGDPVVYAHTSDKLYSVDPATFSVTLIAAFKWPGSMDQMTDIALDRKGKMTGISFDKVYSVDPKTAACTFLSKLQTPTGVGSFNGLSYIAMQSSDVKEVLMASALDGSLYELNPATGQSKKAGNFGGGLRSSGDLVSVKGLTLATVNKGTEKYDWLARVDPSSGKATLIGNTGFADIWGLGYWKDKVYGFTDTQRMILIDPKTGKGTQVGASAAPWWGAGVTTAAPVIE